MVLKTRDKFENDSSRQPTICCKNDQVKMRVLDGEIRWCYWKSIAVTANKYI